MPTRPPIAVVALLGAFCVAASPALATDSPSPAAFQDAPPVSTLKGVLGKCTDNSRPTSGFGAKSARTARRTRVLHGSASDKGCGVAMVTISIARVHAKRCQVVGTKGRLGRPGRCSATHFLMAKGTGKWHLRLPRGLPHGTYVVTTRAIDFAGNVQPAHSLHLTLG